MKKQYTRKQIVEAMKKWQKVLEAMDSKSISIEEFCQKHNYPEEIYNKILEMISIRLGKDVLVNVNGREEEQDFEYDDIYFITDAEGYCTYHQGTFSSSTEDSDEYYGHVENNDVEVSIDDKSLFEIGLVAEDHSDYDAFEYDNFQPKTNQATFTLRLQFEVKISDPTKFTAFLGDSIPLIGEEETFQPKTSKQKIDESESGFDIVHSVTSYFARDLIYDDAPEGIKVCEIPDSRYFGLRKLPIEIKKEDVEKSKKIYQENPQYRVMAYYVNGYGDSKWSDANDNIEDEGDFKNYIDRDSSFWEYDQESFEDIAVPFMKQFQTYHDWVSHKATNAKKDILEAFSYSNKLPYESINGEDIQFTIDGDAYILIAWRA